MDFMAKDKCRAEPRHAAYKTVNEVLDGYGSLRKALVVTALPLEMEAVRGHVADIGSVVGTGGPICECGRFKDPNGDWLVVVVECGRGNAEAQSAAERAYRNFRKFDIQLMIGVGGSLKDDVPVGSVVASDRVHSVRGAKHAPDVVSSRPKTIPADVDLVEIAKKVARDRVWPTRVRDPRNGELPPRGDETYPGQWPPVALVAPIGSSEEILADADSPLAAWLAERYGDACVVEMEGYGAMFAASRERTPAIVLRGISDLASSDKTPAKDAVMQPVAACHAAAFGFEMLSHWAAAREVERVVDQEAAVSPRMHDEREKPADPDELNEIRGQFAAASAVLLRWPRTLPDGQEIERPESKTLVSRIEGESTSTTVVLGAAGAGKSALLAELAHRYVARDWPVLAIKSDLIDGSVSTEEGLKDHLGLGIKPGDALRMLGKSEPVLLIIDQLDALAGFLDLRTNRLNALLGLVRRIGGQENVHIVMSSRAFEYEHDVRLRSAGGDCLTLELPAWSRILEILEGKGVAASEWPADAQEVIRSPQALAIYLGFADGRREPFATYQQMLDAVWYDRVVGGEGGVERGRVATAVAEEMASEETLWLAGARFDGDAERVDRLAAAGVLRRSEGRIGFAHQTLFEHVLARRFARSEGALSGFVFERQESLFVRPKLLAGLNYIRAVEEARYHEEIETMWSKGDLRRHIRVLLLDYLGSQSRPTDREAVVMGSALRDPELRWHAFRAVSGSDGWFERLADGFVAPTMLEPGEPAERMVGVLIAAWRFAPQRVVELIRKVWAADRAFDLYTWGVLSRVWDWPEDALRVACDVVERTEIPTNDVNYVVETLGAAQPETALRLTHARLRREFSEALGRVREIKAAAADEESEGETDDSWLKMRERPLEDLVERRQDWSGLNALAEAESEMFLKTLWPWFESVFRSLLELEGDDDGGVGYALPLVADFRFEEEGADLPPSDVLSALRIAAEGVADGYPDVWLEWVGRVSQLNVTAAHRLIAHGFALSPERFGEDALTYLLGDERRFVLGSTQDLTGTSQRLVRAVGGHWDSEEVARFEEALDGYRPRAPARLVEAKERRSWTQTVGRIGHALRQALPEDRRSTEAGRRIQEDGRAYPDATLGSRSWWGQVGPVMNADAIAKASDDDVVNAFRKLPDATGWDHPKRFMAGGNIQLARAFAVFGKGNPERAARILRQLNPENGARAAGNVLETLAGEGDPAFVIAILRDALNRGFDSQGFRESACRAIGRLVGQRDVEVEGDLVDVVERWLGNPASEDTAEGEEDSEGGPAEGKDETFAGPDVDESDDVLEERHDVVRDSMLWGGGTVALVPGGDFPVLECLIRLRLRRKEYDELHRAMHGYLDRCADTEIWSHLLPYFDDPPAGRVDGAKILIERVLAEVPGIVGTVPATLAIARAAFRWEPALADRELDRWRNAEGSASRQAYGEIVGLAATSTTHRQGWAEGRLAKIVVDGSLVDARAGAALTAVNRWSDGRVRREMSKLVVDLLSTGEIGVWRAVFDLFRVVDRLAPDEETVQLLEAMRGRVGEAPPVDASFLAEQLGTLLPHEAPLVGLLAMGIVASQSRVSGLAAANFVDLAVTLHRLGGETRKAGTELFEALLDKGVPEARTTLDEIDNRTGRKVPRRPRMRRRRR